MVENAPRLLAIMGSGETAPTMAAVHRELFERLGLAQPRAVLLDAPFGFQENADELTARTVRYFEHNLGRELRPAPLRSASAASAGELAAHLAVVRDADYVFAGPGSPSYALAQWQQAGLAPVLVEKLTSGSGCVVFASAAALTLGRVALPVYEVYKVGQPPVWLDALDVLAALDIHAALIPHWDNAEGGTHDTRYCYMGERRLHVLEGMLPEGIHVIGVDEHTACIVDLLTGQVVVRGRGRVTVRSHGEERQYSAGATLDIDALRGNSPPRGTTVSAPARAGVQTTTSEDTAPAQRARTLDEDVREHSASLREALRAGEAERARDVVLELEDRIEQWRSDPDESDALDQARSVLRSSIAALAEAARSGTRDLRPVVAPFIEALLALRAEARQARRFADADRVRDVLVAAGVEVQDTPDGSQWSLAADFGHGDG